MRQLTQDEKHSVGKHLKNFDIKFVEIYDEIYDHFVSSIESRCQKGDDRDVTAIFNDILHDEFSGAGGIKGIESSRIEMVTNYLRNSLKEKLVSLLTTYRIFHIIFVAMGIYLFLMMLQPSSKMTGLIFLGLILTSYIPFIYFRISSYNRRNNLYQNFTKKYSVVQSVAFNLICNWSTIVYSIVYLIPMVIIFLGNKETNHFNVFLYDLLGNIGISIISSAVICGTFYIFQVLKTEYSLIFKS